MMHGAAAATDPRPHHEDDCEEYVPLRPSGQNLLRLPRNFTGRVAAESCRRQNLFSRHEAFVPPKRTLINRTEEGMELPKAQSPEIREEVSTG